MNEWDRLRAIEKAVRVLAPDLRCSKQSVIMPDEEYPEDYTWTTCISRDDPHRCTACDVLFALAA
jgi:hypothetical protein